MRRRILKNNSSITTETWMINEDIFFENAIYEVSFKSNGQKFDKIVQVYNYDPYSPSSSIAYMEFGDVVVFYVDFLLQQTIWNNDLYRLIELDSPATGNLLTWLLEHASRQ